ncbi:MAG: putative O-acetyltransferase [Frankiales bacterium]|nr:putative O-acetyltransferase [Frankiales bacterium]
MTALAEAPSAAPPPAPPAVPAQQLAAGRRVDALDGVRAIGVTTVVTIHALPASSFPGAVGVDVFFVVSGYLITTLLLAEKARYGDISVPRFWARRFLRIAPPLLFMLAALYPLGHALVGDDYLPRALLAGEFRSNLALTVQRVSISPLDHTWSLGQEAQFYVVWPLLLVALLALRVPRPVLAAACAAGTAWCFHALHVVQTHSPTPTDDFRLDGRGGGLLAGCALAFLLSWRRQLLALPGLAEAGLVLLLGMYAYGCLVERVPLQTSVPVAVVAAVLLVGGLLGRARGPASWLLALPPVVFVGRISYSLYLWHYVFFRAFEKRPDLSQALVLVLEVTFAVAAAAMSFTVIEQPIARWSARRLHRGGSHR